MKRVMMGILVVATACCRKGEKKEPIQQVEKADTAKNSSTGAGTGTTLLRG
jgi:hypothetical protein